MTDRIQPRIAITDDHGRSVGSAELDFVGTDTARASLHVESGQLPAGSRRRLVDALLDDASLCSCVQLQVAVPIGDTEMLERLRDRCAVHGTRAVGSTCLMDVTPPDVESGH